MISIFNQKILVKCGRKCLCQYRIDNNHLKLSVDEIMKIVNNSNKKSFCFYDYDGSRKKIEMRLLKKAI